jgi:FixJ family two-component response regulator
MPEPSHIVAVVDDNDGVRKALAHFLRALGYTPKLYASATSFLAAVGSSEAMCLLIDVQLGDVCGIGLGCDVATAGLKMPIVYMTASADESIRRRALDAGCVAFLRKPFAPSALVDALNKARVRRERD